MDRTHRPIVPKTAHSIEMEVKSVSVDHVILTSPETGDFSWPLKKLPDNLREKITVGDRLPLSLKTLDEMHQLLERLVR